MAVLRMGQRFRIAPRTILKARESEAKYADRLIVRHVASWGDPRPLATIIPFPVERRLASMNNDAS
jgi:hypothetical protein